MNYIINIAMILLGLVIVGLNAVEISDTYRKSHPFVEKMTYGGSTDHVASHTLPSRSHFGRKSTNEIQMIDGNGAIREKEGERK